MANKEERANPLVLGKSPPPAPRMSTPPLVLNKHEEMVLASTDRNTNSQTVPTSSQANSSVTNTTPDPLLHLGQAGTSD